MRIFNFDEKYSVVCRSESTRSGFRHLATLMRNGKETAIEAKCTYQNRTWERFTYESVLYALVEKMFKADAYFTEEDIATFKAKIETFN